MTQPAQSRQPHGERPHRPDAQAQQAGRQPKKQILKGRVMPQNPLPPYIAARIARLPSLCALARLINQPYVGRMCPELWKQWAKRSLCWRHRLPGKDL
jgi:hypothetical protein